MILPATNPIFPNVILKKGCEQHLEQEAERMWVLRHPNVAVLYGIVGKGEYQPDGSPVAYLAIKQEGPDLATLLTDPMHA